MNGGVTTTDSIYTPFVDRRPLVTCAGELEVFSSIEDALLQALPQDTCEWRRSLGRPVRKVHVAANFTPFSPVALSKLNQWDLVRQPVFHIYWTECNDVDVYKTKVRDDVESWLKELNAKDISDWMIVVVENYDGKRANKLLPRTTVLDKIRAEFGPKQGDRCISVINPGKLEGRSTDSWRGLLSRIRHLLLMGYSKAVSKLEDHVRHQRERRNDPGWNFMEYFKLQEELAQVLEMLGLYDEALVQYDELDALFSQFVVNGPNDNVKWLGVFQKPLERWHGLKLGPMSIPESPSLLELRAYLFAKQAHMLLLVDKVWEVASRCLPFLHTCTKELSLLEISSPPGAVACWLFLACLEVLHACDEHNRADQIEAYSLNTASLWAYSSQKLRYLGELCGLMPSCSPTSDQLHTVVYLSAGMGDNPGKEGCPSATDKLKQAVCSQVAFNKTYLELAELAMGTYKHIGRIRSARLIGREVASFYMLLGEVQKSAAFLGDALRTFELDNWRELAAQTQIELSECFKKSGDTRKYIRSCAAVAAAPEIDNLIRLGHFDEMQKSLDALERVLIVPFKDIIKVTSVNLKSETVMQDSEVEVELVVECNFPREIVCDKAMVSLEVDTQKKGAGRRSSNVITRKNSKQLDCTRLNIQRHLDYQQDKQLSSASVVCKNVSLKRVDSNAAPAYHSEFSEYLVSVKNPFVLTPGANVIRLKRRCADVGKFILGQIALHMKLMELISTTLTPKPFFQVQREEPKVRLDKGGDALIAGVEQVMQLSVVVGSYSIETDSKIVLKSSPGLTMQTSNGPANQQEFTISATSPNNTTSILIPVLAEMPSKEHQITISCPWIAKTIPVTLSFAPPVTIVWRLHTVKHRKFIYAFVTGQCDKDLLVRETQLQLANGMIIKEVSRFAEQLLPKGSSLSVAFELLFTPSKETPAVKASLLIKYALSDVQECKEYRYLFELSDYQTLYNVEAKVEPTKGSEFCRVGTLCHLELSISPVNEFLESNGSLMYEVLAEQSLWAVCGRTAGVLSFDGTADTQSVVLDVMPLNSGYLPLPGIRLSKYIPGDADGYAGSKGDQHPKLEPFKIGQVYNSSKGRQIHVISSAETALPP